MLAADHPATESAGVSAGKHQTHVLKHHPLPSQASFFTVQETSVPQHGSLKALPAPLPASTRSMEVKIQKPGARNKANRGQRTSQACWLFKPCQL